MQAKIKPIDRARKFTINKLHMQFLGELCETWPVIRELRRAKKENKRTHVEECDRELRKIGKRAEGYYKDILKVRTFVMTMYHKDERFREEEDKACAKDFVRWINYYAWTFDPRLPPLGLPAHVPFILWPQQEEFLLFVDDHYRHPGPWLADKSRGVGLTWLICAYYVHHWLYVPGFVGGLGSRKEELVDKHGDPNTLFSKIRYIIDNLPAKMRPEGFDQDRRRCDNLLRIVNPANNSSIIGEGGDNIGRGGRTSMYVVDEKASVEQQALVDRALSFTTNTQGDISTPNGMNHFGRKRHGMLGDVDVFTLMWYYDPAKNPHYESGRKPEHNEWYELQKEIHDKVTIAQEVDCDYQASVEGTFIPPEWIEAAVDFEIDAEGVAACGFDPAGQGKNEAVYTSRIGPVVNDPIVLPYDSVVQAAWAAVDKAEEERMEVMSYDMGGLGQSIGGLLQYGDREIKFKYNGVDNSSAASDEFVVDQVGEQSENKRYYDMFGNLRAELWWRVRERFRKVYEHRNKIRFYRPDEMISIPNHALLKQQLGAPLLKYKGGGGKKMVESKVDMRKRGVDSPDIADSLVLSFASEVMNRVVDSVDERTSRGHYRSFELDPESGRNDHYVVIVQTKDMVTHVLLCLWHRSMIAPKLMIYDEAVVPNAQPKEVVAYVRGAFEVGRQPIREWVGNDEMFKDDKAGRLAPWRLYRQEGVVLRQNYLAGDRASIMLLNKMFQADMIQIHPNCETFFHQVRQWGRKKAVPEEPHGLVQCATLLISRLRQKKIIRDAKPKPEPEPYKRRGRWSRVARGTYPNVNEEFAQNAGYYQRKRKRIQGAVR